MKREVQLFIMLVCCCMFLVGCQKEQDTIEIYNKSITNFDNVTINTPNGYFYERHEKNKIDDNTVAITIYFSNVENNTWE